MNKKIGIFIFSLIFAMMVEQAQAQKAQKGKEKTAEEIAICKKPDDVKVDLHIDYGTLRYNETRSIKEMSFELSQNLRDVYGLLKNSMSYKMTAHFQTNYQHCVYLESVEINYKLDELIVYIDESLEPDSCRYDIVKKQVNEDVRALRTSIRQKAPAVKKELVEKLTAIKPKKMIRNEEGFRKQAVEQLKNEANQITKETMQKLTDQIEEEKKKADKNKPEAEFLFRKCPVEKYVE